MLCNCFATHNVHTPILITLVLLCFYIYYLQYMLRFNKSGAVMLAKVPWLAAASCGGSPSSLKYGRGELWVVHAPIRERITAWEGWSAPEFMFFFETVYNYYILCFRARYWSKVSQLTIKEMYIYFNYEWHCSKKKYKTKITRKRLKGPASKSSR